MTPPDDLLAIIDRIAGGEYAEVDLQRLRRALTVGDRQDVLQLGKYNVNIGQGQDIQIGDRNYQGADAEAIKEILQDALKSLQPNTQPTGIPENLPRSGVVQFVGREEELAALHQQLQENERVAVSAIAGMGGIGKTELALQYALRYKQTYQGGICWLQARGVDVGTQIVQFGRSRLQLNPSEELDLPAQVGFCWTHWQPGEVLVIIDDVLDYKLIKAYLPPSDSRFKVLITSRLRLGKSVKQLEIEVLEESSAIALLASLTGSDRLQQELDKAKQLCKWLGYLPLALELVGRYLDRSPDLSIAEMQRRLEKKRLEERSLRKPDDDMTLSLGVAAAFDLSWETLDDETKELSCLLSLFALAPIPWILVEQVAVDHDPDDLEEIRDDNLVNLHLLQRKGKDIYQLHQLIREFIHLKAEQEKYDITQLKVGFCTVMANIGKSVPESPTRNDLNRLTMPIPHIAEAASKWIHALPDRYIVAPFQGLGRFYESQGLYKQAEIWYKSCLQEAEKRFCSENLTVATSLSNLGSNYFKQGKYNETEPLYKKSLEIRQQLLGEKHADIASSLNDLALLKKYQGEYSISKDLYSSSLKMRILLFGELNTDVADSLNNLGLLYDEQGRYEEAKLLLEKSLGIRKQLRGKEHPEVAESLNNLASLYHSQEKYEEAIKLYYESLELTRILLGDKHRDVATTLSNLGQAFSDKKKYKEAEHHLIEALQIRQEILGNEHPELANTLNNIGVLYVNIGDLSRAEELYLKALEIRKKIFGENHVIIANSYNNLAKLSSLQQDYPSAESLYMKALDILEDKLGTDHPITDIVRDGLQKARDNLKKR
jgi:tetratricopeptide (TPR) repeat protein